MPRSVERQPETGTHREYRCRACAKSCRNGQSYRSGISGIMMDVISSSAAQTFLRYPSTNFPRAPTVIRRISQPHTGLQGDKDGNRIADRRGGPRLPPRVAIDLICREPKTESCAPERTTRLLPVRISWSVTPAPMASISPSARRVRSSGIPERSSIEARCSAFL